MKMLDGYRKLMKIPLRFYGAQCICKDLFESSLQWNSNAVIDVRMAVHAKFFCESENGSGAERGE